MRLLSLPLLAVQQWTSAAAYEYAGSPSSQQAAGPSTKTTSLFLELLAAEHLSSSSSSSEEYDARTIDRLLREASLIELESHAALLVENRSRQRSSTALRLKQRLEAELRERYGIPTGKRGDDGIVQTGFLGLRGLSYLWLFDAVFSPMRWPAVRMRVCVDHFWSLLWSSL